jgi:hypothetical protein
MCNYTALCVSLAYEAEHYNKPPMQRLVRSWKVHGAYDEGRELRRENSDTGNHFVDIPRCSGYVTVQHLHSAVVQSRGVDIKPRSDSHKSAIYPSFDPCLPNSMQTSSPVNRCGTERGANCAAQSMPCPKQKSKRREDGKKERRKRLR